MKMIGRPYSSEELFKLVRKNRNQGEKEATQAIKDFEKYAQDKVDKLQKKIDNAKNDSERNIARDRLKRTKDELEAEYKKFKYLNNVFKVGNVISFDSRFFSVDMPSVGVVVSKAKRGNPVNPLAPGSWRIKIAIPDGTRTLSVSMNAFTDDQAETRVNDKDKKAAYVDTAPRSLEDIGKEFDSAHSISRERRFIATGNLFSGFALLRNEPGKRIIYFTRNDGSIDQGILLSRSFSLQDARDSMPVMIDNGDQIAAILQQSNGDISPVLSSNMAVEFTLDPENNMVMKIPGSRSVSGPFMFDQRIADMGVEFVRRGQGMVSDPLSTSQVNELAKIAAEIFGGNWQVPASETQSNKESAQQIINQDRQQRYSSDDSIAENQAEYSAVNEISSAPASVYLAPEVSKTKARKLRSVPVEIGKFKAHKEKIDGYEDVATLLQPLAAKAQETLMALVMDKKSKPIAIISHSVGGVNSSQVFTGHLIGQIRNIPEATKIYLAHNHPSGDISPSPADSDLTAKIQMVSDAAGLRLMGHVILSPIDGRYATMARTGTLTDINGKISPVLDAEKKYDVPVVERRLTGTAPAFPEKYAGGISDAASALPMLKDMSKGKSGIMLLDTKLRPLKFVPMTPGRMKGLRVGGAKSGAANLLKAIDSANASAFMAYTNTEYPDQAVTDNLTRFSKATATRFLDVVTKTGKSAVNEGMVNNLSDDLFLETSEGGKPIAPKHKGVARQELEDHLGKKAVKALEDAGVLKIITPEEAIELLKSFAGKRKDVQMIMDGKAVTPGFHINGTVYMVDGWMSPGKAVPNLMHEIGVHLTHLGFKDSKTFQNILNMIQKRANANTEEGKEIRAAMEKVPESTPESKKAEEVLAYLIGNGKTKLNVVRRFIAALKKFLVDRLGVSASIFTVDDLHAIAQGLLSSGKITPHSEMKGKQDVQAEITDYLNSPDEWKKFIKQTPTETIRGTAGTENLHYEKEGVKSKTSESRGAKIIQEIMQKLNVAKNPEAAAKSLKDDRKRIEELVSAYEEVMQVLNDPMKSIAEKQKFAAAFAKKLPRNVRSELLAKLSGISRVKTEKAQQKRLDAFLTMADKTVSTVLRRDIMNTIKTTLKEKKRRRGDVKRGIGHELEADLKYMRELLDRIAKKPVSRTIKGKETQVRVLRSHNETMEAIAAEQGRLQERQAKLNDKYAQALMAGDEKKAGRLFEQIVDIDSKLNLLSMFGDLFHQDIYQLSQSRNTLFEMIASGRAYWRMQKEALRERNARNIAMVAKELTGEEKPELETLDERKKRIERERSIRGKAKAAFLFMENLVQSWEGLMDKVSLQAKKGILNSDTIKHFGSIVHKATRDNERFTLQEEKRLNRKMMEIFGIKTEGRSEQSAARALAKKLSEANKPVENAVRYTPKEHERRITMSPMEAAYWYAIRKAQGKDQAVANKTFTKMGLTENSWKDIEKLMGPQVKAWVDFIVDDYLQSDFYDSLNEVYRRKYGIALEKRVGYFPWMREYEGDPWELQLGGQPSFLEGTEMGTIKKGSLIPRVSNSRPFKLMNFNDVLTRHIAEMNHFKAWAIPLEEITGTFQHPYMRKLIRQHRGPADLDAIQKHIQRFMQSPVRNYQDFAKLDKWRARITRAMVGGVAPIIVMKQLTSIPAYAAYMPVTEWIKYSTKLLANPANLVRAAKELKAASVAIQARYAKGMSRDISEAMTRDTSGMLTLKKQLGDYIMAPTRFGDVAAIVLGGWPLYKYKYDQYVKQGMSHKQAQSKAIMDFEMATERSQQSRHTKDMGWMQSGTPIMKLFTMFIQAPASYTRMQFMAARHFSDDPVKAVKFLAVFGGILPAAFQAVAIGFLMGAGDDEDEQKKKFMKEMAKSILISPFMGIPIVRSVAEAAGNLIIGGHAYDFQLSPVSQVLTDMVTMFNYASKAITGGTARIDEAEYRKRTAEKAADVAGYLTGIPVRRTRTQISGILEAMRGETEYPVRASMGYSKTARGER